MRLMPFSECYIGLRDCVWWEARRHIDRLSGPINRLAPVHGQSTGGMVQECLKKVKNLDTDYSGLASTAVE